MDDHESPRILTAEAIAAARPINFRIALNVRHRLCHQAADAFWAYWNANGETHKRGYYESTWGAINRAIRMVGTVPHDYGEALGAGRPSQADSRSNQQGEGRCARALPPLPQAASRGALPFVHNPMDTNSRVSTFVVDFYTEPQMQAYARAAVEALKSDEGDLGVTLRGGDAE